MPLLADDVRDAWRLTPTSPQFWLLNAAFTLSVGLALLASEPARVSSAAFITIRQYGGPTAWGFGLALIGALIAVAPFLGARTVTLALGLASVLYLLLAAGFVAAAVQDDRAALLGPLFALYPAFTSALHSRHYWRIAMRTADPDTVGTEGMGPVA